MRRRRTFPLLMLCIGAGFFVAGLTKPQTEFVGIGVSAMFLSLIFLRQDYRSLIDDAHRDEQRKKLIEARDNLLNHINETDRSE